MKKFIISFCVCMGSLIESGFSMMDYETSPAQQKIVSKGFKPQPQVQNEKLNSAKKQSPSEEESLLYDSERDMYYYGKNLSEAAKKNHNDSHSSKAVTNDGVVSLEEEK